MCPEGGRDRPLGRKRGLLVAGGFHSIVGQRLGFRQGFVNRLLASVDSRELLADFSGDTGELRDSRELNTNVGRRFNGGVVRVSGVAGVSAVVGQRIGDVWNPVSCWPADRLTR